MDQIKLRQIDGGGNVLELPPGITPQMLQMLQKMMAEQEAASVSTGGARGGKPAERYSGAAAKAKEVKPEDVIALDDKDFGRF